jgi:hypothetical protein
VDASSLVRGRAKEARSLVELALAGAKKPVPGNLRRIYGKKAARGELDALVDERGTRLLEERDRQLLPSRLVSLVM